MRIHQKTRKNSKTKKRRLQRGGVSTLTNLMAMNKSVSPSSDTPYALYLSKVDGLSPAIKTYLMNKMLIAMDVAYFKDIEANVMQSILSLYKKPRMCINDPVWGTCHRTCEAGVTHLMNIEMESTAFMLRCIAESVLPKTEQITFSIVKGSNLTGLWQEDKGSITISRLGDPEKKSRCIMGFGPSAAGKTYWATTIINLMQMSDPNFPTAFLSVDGGIYRESSAVYKSVVKGAQEVCLLGFDNLVRAGVSAAFGSSLFDADIVKKAVMDYLEDSEVPISVYVPDTLGGCGGVFGGNCYKKYQKYITLANDSEGWIGLLIWQHVRGDKCNLRDDADRKCVGCTESGMSREMQEGKKYSASAYPYSMANGEAAFKTAPGGCYKIHNCGRRDGISMLEDHTLYSSAKYNVPSILKANESLGYDYTQIR